MSQFEQQYRELRSFLEFKDYNILTKRIIDLALDTESVNFYKRTIAFLEWLDTMPSDADKKHERFHNILVELHDFLKSKPVADRKLLVSTKSLKKSYGEASFALGPINMELRQGEIIGLVGENGNGKTTLLRLLCGELFPTSGELKYHFDYADAFHLRTQLVYIPQRTDTWHGSMFENLQFTAASYGYTADENALIVELTIARLGLRKFRNHSWKSLSSGYKMRFELARMLLRKPQILLIDEPLANLDILAQQTILEDFRAIAKSPFRPIGIVMSSQQLYEVEKTSDEVLFLKNGIQKNLFNAAIPGAEQNESNSQFLVIEFESSWPQSELAALFTKFDMTSLEFTGGSYIVTFPSTFTVTDFMRLAADNELPLLYFRNISNSTRRFFVS